MQPLDVSYMSSFERVLKVEVARVEIACNLYGSGFSEFCLRHGLLGYFDSANLITLLSSVRLFMWALHNVIMGCLSLVQTKLKNLYHRVQKNIIRSLYEKC